MGRENLSSEKKKAMPAITRLGSYGTTAVVQLEKKNLHMLTHTLAGKAQPSERSRGGGVRNSRAQGFSTPSARRFASNFCELIPSPSSVYRNTSYTYVDTLAPGAYLVRAVDVCRYLRFLFFALSAAVAFSGLKKRSKIIE